MKTLVSDYMAGVMAGLAWTRPPGCFVEVGVYQGGTARALYAVSERQGRQLYLYDTFSGMPFKGEFDKHAVGDFSDCSAEEIMEMLPNASVIKGIFPQSAIKMPPIAFVHADADQYQSTKDICETLGPLMVSGGIMLFDDYYCIPGCVKAVDECFPRRKTLPDGRAVVEF